MGGIEVNLNRVVSNIIGEYNYSHCRLCLREVTVQEYVRFEDLYSLDVESLEFQPMKDILLYLGLVSEIKEIPGIDAICKSCTEKALECAQFLNQCKKSTELLNNTIDNLYDTLSLNIEIPTNNQKLYVNIFEHDTKIVIVDEQCEQRKKNENYKQKQFVCSQCNVGFGSMLEAQKHNITYHSCLTCEKCLETFPDETNLKHHVTIKHRYKCLECSQFCSTKESLQEHYDRLHKVYLCKYCEKSCKGTDRLKSHEHYHTNKTESKQCPKCGKTYQTRSFFLNHTKYCLQGLLDPHPIRSNLEKPFSCEKCGKGYSTFGALRVHMRFEHGNARYHVCEHCGKKFTAPSCLKTHMVTHTGEKNFQCTICNRKFVSKEALLYHTRRHTGEKPYSCHICQEKFVNASARAEHIKYKHVGPKLQCTICSRKFVTSYFLRKHMELHHDPRSKLYQDISAMEQNLKITTNNILVPTQMMFMDGN